MAGTRGRRWKCRSRPCSVCRKRFVPHARTRRTQRTCGLAPCRKEQHRRSRAAWRAAHPDYEREERLRERLRADDAQGSGASSGDPLRSIDWSAAREAIGLQVSVVIEETAQVLTRSAREAMRAQRIEIARETAQVPPMGAREAIGARSRPP